jgi:hypothetical protein
MVPLREHFIDCTSLANRTRGIASNFRIVKQFKKPIGERQRASGLFLTKSALEICKRLSDKSQGRQAMKYAPMPMPI